MRPESLDIGVVFQMPTGKRAHVVVAHFPTYPNSQTDAVITACGRRENSAYLMHVDYRRQPPMCSRCQSRLDLLAIKVIGYQERYARNGHAKD